MNSGASDASGATHCTSRNRSMPSWVPVVMRESAKGSAESTITAAANTNSPVTSRRRGRHGRAPIRAAGPTRSGSDLSAREAFHR
jgi:hypothetical protein